MKEINFKPATNKKSNAEKAKNQMLESNDFRQQMRYLEKIYAIPPDYRMEAASYFRVEHIYRHNHNSLSWHNESLFQNNELRNFILSYFEGKARNETEWGRKRNHWHGNRVLDFPATTRTESRPAGKWTSYDYYADYSVFFHRSKPHLLVSYDNKCYKIDLSEPFDEFGGYSHIVNSKGFSEKLESGEWEWDTKELSIREGSEEYHVSQKQLYLTIQDAEKLFRKISTAFETRKKRKEEAVKNLDIPDDLIIKASYSTPSTSGNCNIGTSRFRKKYKLTDKDEYTVSELKEKGVDFSNQYLQRAIKYAQNH